MISFHSLEDRIVKQTFLDIIGSGDGDENYENFTVLKKDDTGIDGETWSKQRIEGKHGTILTKRPVTPTEEEEKLNHRCRSAKLTVASS